MLSLDDLDLALILRSAAGLTIATFDRSCRYTAIFGASLAALEVGRVVGEGNAVMGPLLFVAAQDAIHQRIVTSLDVEIDGRFYEERICPVVHAQFGVIGGVLFGWDITTRFAQMHSTHPIPITDDSQD